jgi:hypothetical protein
MFYPHATVRLFGSCAALRFGSFASDVDLVIIGFDDDGFDSGAVLQQVGRALQDSPACRGGTLDVVTNTRVPVISFTRDCGADDTGTVNFDVTCDVNGLRNTTLLRQYMQQGVQVRAGYVVIKDWAKRCGVINPKQGYLSSYAVSIMWVHYLLRVTRGDGAVDFVDPTAALAAIYDTVDYAPCVPEVNTERLPALQALVGQLVHSFFTFYSKFDWSTNVVTIRTARDVAPEQLAWTAAAEVRHGRVRDRVYYRMCIQDPYEAAGFNLGRHVSPEKFAAITGRFLQKHAACAAHAEALDRVHAPDSTIPRAPSPAHVAAVASGHAPESIVATWMREHGDAHKITVVSDDVNGHRIMTNGSYQWMVTIRCAACDTWLRATGAKTLKTLRKHVTSAAHVAAVNNGFAGSSFL